MTNATGLIVGGLLPAFAFGVGAIFQKCSNDIGIGQSSYLLFFAVGIVLASLVAYVAIPEHSFSVRAGLFASGHGLLFGAGFVLLALGLTLFSQPIAKLVPLANMSTLVAVFLGLAIFGEHTKLNLSYLLPGAVLIVFGGVLVGRA